MFKQILEKASRHSKVVASKIKTIKPTVLKDFKFNGQSFKSQFFEYDKSTDSPFNSKNQQSNRSNQQLGLFSLIKGKITSFWSNFSGKLLISESSDNKKITDAPKPDGPLKVVVQTIKTVVIKFSNSFGLIKFRNSFSSIIRINDWLPTLVNQASSKYIVVRDVAKKQYLVISSRAQHFIKKHKDHEANKSFKNYLVKLNSTIDKKSQDLSRFKFSKIEFGNLQKLSETIKRRASSSDFFSIFTVNVTKMNNVLRSDGIEKKFYMFKLKAQKYLTEIIYPMSMMNKIKLALAVLLVLSTLSFAIKKMYDSHRSRRLDKQIDKAFNLIEEVKKQNEEISRNNDSLRLFLEREKYKSKGLIDGAKGM